MAQINFKTVLISVFKKILNPVSLIRLIQIKREKRKKPIFFDTTLKLYSKMSPGDFLHFPYFPDPNIEPDDVSINDIKNGLISYSNLLIDLIMDKKLPVLDLGCGMGGLIEILLKRGYIPVALTPDYYQVDYIKKKYPDIDIIESTFEEMNYKPFRYHFGTIITAESLQYINLERSLPIIDYILKPKGRWIVSDFFQTAESQLAAGHDWDDFVKRIAENGWKIELQRDITQHVLPFLGYFQILTNRIFLPFVDFLIDSFQQIKPGVYFLLEDIVTMLRKDVSERVKYVNPEIFSKERKYMLLVFERSE